MKLDAVEVKYGPQRLQREQVVSLGRAQKTPSGNHPMTCLDARQQSPHPNNGHRFPRPELIYTTTGTTPTSSTPWANSPRRQGRVGTVAGHRRRRRQARVASQRAGWPGSVVSRRRALSIGADTTIQHTCPPSRSITTTSSHIPSTLSAWTNDTPTPSGSRSTAQRPGSSTRASRDGAAPLAGHTSRPFLRPWRMTFPNASSSFTRTRRGSKSPGRRRRRSCRSSGSS